jgi:hypothetical protein
MKIAGIEFKLGADPELFIVRKSTGKLVSAHGMLPGSKEKPFRVPHGAVQVDGMAAEFNIDPARSVGDFVRNIKSVMQSLQDIIGDEYELKAIPTAHFGKKMIDAQPDEAKILGCDPDFDAWYHRKNPTPDVEAPFRTGAGHLHIGWTKGVDENLESHTRICEHLIRNLDLYTTPFLALEDDVLRRELYGKAGAYRPKSYGVEYRTPSNVWLTSEKNMRLMWALARAAIIACVKGEGMLQKGDMDGRYLKATFAEGKGGYDYKDWCKYQHILRQVGMEVDMGNQPPVEEKEVDPRAPLFQRRPRLEW